MSLNVMLISSKDFSASSSFLKDYVNHLLNLSIITPLTHLFIFKSNNASGFESLAFYIGFILTFDTYASSVEKTEDHFTIYTL